LPAAIEEKKEQIVIYITDARRFLLLRAKRSAGWWGGAAQKRPCGEAAESCTGSLEVAGSRRSVSPGTAILQAKSVGARSAKFFARL
jgi:hypothetical protein